MKGLDFTNSPAVFLEITPNALRALSGTEGFDLPLERGAGGRLTQAVRDQIVDRLQKLAHRQAWQGRAPAYCAIPSRGVSFRRLALPPVPKEEIHRVLQLQIENEFPLPPEELAWGYRLLPGRDSKKREVLVAAVKKESVQEYADLLTTAGLAPIFTPAPLARAGLCPSSVGTCAMLDVGDVASEWMVFAEGLPKTQRSLQWGEAILIGALQDALGIHRADATLALTEWYSGSLLGTERAAKIDEACDKTVGPLVEMAGANESGQTIYLTGRPALGPKFPGLLVTRLGGNSPCERIETPDQPGRSAAILGLQALLAKQGPEALVSIHLGTASAPVARRKLLAPNKWAAMAAALLVACLAFPYVEALVMKPFVARRVAAVKAKKGRLGGIDRELEFLQYIKDNQPPYLDAMYLFANAAQGGGWKMDSISMNRRGEVSLSGSLRDPQQIGTFRSKLIDSGFFSSVVVEEQTPSPDRQKFTVRLSAQWKSGIERESLSIGPALPDSAKPTNASPTSATGAGATNAPPKSSATNSPAAVTNQPPKEPTHAEDKR
ncbi:MAG TPA: hypothetical protein VMF06_03140 [Candidatus Limnocylindria bacterium]|nr:hypothetical protein [Candidatus Limnocylindria bacterium]